MSFSAASYRKSRRGRKRQDRHNTKPWERLALQKVSRGDIDQDKFVKVVTKQPLNSQEIRGQSMCQRQYRPSRLEGVVLPGDDGDLLKTIRTMANNTKDPKFRKCLVRVALRMMELHRHDTQKVLYMHTHTHTHKLTK